MAPLESLVPDPSLFSSGMDTRAALYRIFLKIWSPVDINWASRHSAATDPEAAAIPPALNLTPRFRQVFLEGRAGWLAATGKQGNGVMNSVSVSGVSPSDQEHHVQLRRAVIASTIGTASLGYQLASVIAGGPAPLIATWLLDQYQSAYAISAYILACSALSLIAAALMQDYTGKSIEGEHA